MATVNLTQLPEEYLNANQGPKVDAITIFAFTLAVVAVTLRFLARWLTKASLWWDDWLVLAALFFATGPLALTVLLVDNNFGKHAAVAGMPSTLLFFKALYAFEIVYPFPIALTKFSILMYYKRLFRVQSIKLPIYLVIGLIVCWMIYTEASAIFTCTPIRKVWDPTVVGGTCIDIRSFFIGIAVPNVFTDLALLVIPLPYIWGLQVKLVQKIAVMFVFILGGFIFIVSIVRLTALLSIDNTDPTWSYVPTCIWTNVEVHIGIVTASVPAFWPLLRAVATGHVLSRSQRQQTNTTGITGANTSPSFLSRSRRTKNNITTHDDEQGFVYLKDMGSESPAPSRQGNAESDSEERGVRFTAPQQVQEKSARIQVRNDWTVSSESYVGRTAEHERSFMK